MGWYGDSGKCPECGDEDVVVMYNNNLIESYYLACTKCGLRLYAGDRKWTVDNSYIDKSIINKRPEDVKLTDIDKTKNENIIPKGMGL